jgi:hypothetical protein
VNDGKTWAAAGNGLPDLPVYHVVASPGDLTGNTVYAATVLGVYGTTDGGASWHLFGAGLPAVRVFSVYVSPDGNAVYAATFGRGTWRISLNGYLDDGGSNQ